MDDFKIIRKPLPNRIQYVKLQGFLDARAVHKLDFVLSYLLDHDVHRLILGLEGADCVAEEAIQVLLSAQGRARQKEGEIVLLKPSPSFKDDLSIAGYGGFFAVADSLDEAEGFFPDSNLDSIGRAES